MRAKFLKRICSAILAVAMLMSLAPITTFAITDEDIPASVELGKGFNLLECKTFESANLKSAILFDSVDSLNPTKVRLGNVESNMTYITSMSSYLDNTHTDISTEVGVTKEGLIAKAEVKAKFGFKGEWESSGTVNTSRLILEILAKAYKYSLNMGMSEPWAKDDEGNYLSINPTFAYDLVHMKPETLFKTYGTHIVTQYDAGGEAYTSYEGTDESNSMKSEFDITTNATVNVSAADIADVNVEVNASGGEKHESSFANNNKQTSMRVRGGDPFYSTFDKIIAGDADETVNNWLQSMYTMDENTGSTKATMIMSDNLELMPLWEFLELDYGTDHSARVAELREYFQVNANREYLELYEEFIYGIPGDYADNYDVVNTALITDGNLGIEETVPKGYIPVYSEEELNKIGKSADYPLDGKYILMRNIEMKYNFDGIGYTSSGIQPFTGEFNGNGHTIYDLNPVPRYNGTTEVYMGFVLRNQGDIRNIRFKDSNSDCRASKRTTTTIKTSVKDTATAYLGLVVGRNESESFGYIDNIYIDNATFIVKNAPKTTYFGLCTGYKEHAATRQYITVVNSYIDVNAITDSGSTYVGGVDGRADNATYLISHDNVININKNGYPGGLIGYYSETNDNYRKHSFTYDNEVTSANNSDRQISGNGYLNVYSIGGRDTYATTKKLFAFYCDDDEIARGAGGYAQEWKKHKDTEKKPWLIVHAPNGINAYQNALISTDDLKVYFAEYADDVNSYEDVTDLVNFVYDFSEVADDVPVSVVYGKHLVNFDVDVLEPVVSDISIVNKGKTQFRINEKFDPSSVAIQALYSNNLTDAVGGADENLKYYIPALEGNTPIDLDEFVFVETSTGTEVIVDYMGCRESYQISVIPEDLTGKLHFSASSVESAPGGEFEIVLSLNNNPGIVTLNAWLEYNNDLFEVVEVTDAGLLPGFQNFTDMGTTVPLMWMDQTMSKDHNGSGKLVTVKFKVKEGKYDEAAYGMHTIKCVNGEAFNLAGESIVISPMTVKVKLNETVVGDVDSNSKINAWDALLLTQHTFDIPRGINLAAADINRDTYVDTFDSTYLNRYMVGFFGIDGTPGVFDVTIKSNISGDKILKNVVVNSPLPKPEEKLGYVFKGYYSDAAYENRIEVVPAKSVRNLVVYAKYEPGYVVESDLKLENNLFVLGEELKLCHIINDYSRIENWDVYDGDTLVFTGGSIPADYVPTTGLRVVAKDATVQTFNITYVNDVESTYETENPTAYAYGANITLTNPVSVENANAIKFEGWYENPDFSGVPVTTIEGRAEDITLYAKWSVWTCSINLDAKGGIVEERILQHTYGTETVLPIPTHPNPDYKFVRWVHDGSTVTSVPATFYNEFATYIVYAEWTYAPTINLTLRGSATDPFSEEVEVRNDVNAFAKYSIAVPSEDYETEQQRVYSFLGWYKTGTDVFVTKQYLENVEIDMDLTARWEDATETFVVNFYDHDNTLLHSDEYIYRKSIQFVEAPEYTGNFENDELVFTGWIVNGGMFLGDTDYVDVLRIHNSGERVVDVTAYLRDRSKSVLVTYRHDESYYDFNRTEMAQIYNYLSSRVPTASINSGTQNTIPVDLKSFEKEIWFSIYDTPYMVSLIPNNAIRGTGTMEINGINYCMYYSNGDKLYNRGYIEWASNTYNILCDANPGPGNLLDIMTYTTGGDTVTLPTDVTKEGYVFAGWYDNREFTGDPITEVTGENSGDKIFFAKWVEE